MQRSHPVNEYQPTGYLIVRGPFLNPFPPIEGITPLSLDEVHGIVFGLE